MMMLRVLVCWLLLTSLVWSDASRDFDGTGDFLDMGNINNVTTGDVSLCGWLDVDVGTNIGCLGCKRNSYATATDAGYGLYYTAAEAASFRVCDGVAIFGSIGTTNLDTGTRWKALCGTWDATSEITTVYVDGAQDDTDDYAGVGSLSNTVVFRAGSSAGGGQQVNGRLTYVQQWAVILTLVEINEIMWFPERITTASSTTWGGLWPIWGSDSPEIDLSGDGSTGTVNGTTANADGPPVMFGGGLPL